MEEVQISKPEFRILEASWEQHLARFFQEIHETEDARYFHPHPFTDEEAQKRSRYRGKDAYYIFVDGKTILGYGMLRGWDEGYDVPSLGIIVHPSVRGKGLGRLFMEFLHTVARQRGARKIRLKVYPENAPALNLYRKLGYDFKSMIGEQLIGFLDL